jgi:hypothetical protein
MKTKILILMFLAMIIIGEVAAVTPSAPAYTGAGRGIHAKYMFVDYVASDATANGFGQIAIQTIAAAETTDTDQLKAAAVNEFNSTTHFVLTSSGASSSRFLAQPDVPRNIIGTMNTSTSGSLKLTGTDISGAAITENLTWVAETGAKASTKAFKTVTRVDGTCTTNTAQFIVGVGDLLGLNTKFATNPVIFCALGGTREATAPTVTVSSTVLSQNTIDTNSAPGGAITKVWMVV